LEKNYEGFKTLGWDELVRHGLKALKASAQETELTEHNVSVGFVGKNENEKFRLLSAEELRGFLADVNVSLFPSTD
jgi:20S proteasome alpha/beta subunit